MKNLFLLTFTGYLLLQIFFVPLTETILVLLMLLREQAKCIYGKV